MAKGSGGEEGNVMGRNRLAHDAVLDRIGRAGSAITPIRAGGRVVGYQAAGHAHLTRREAEGAVRQNIARRIPGGEHMTPRELSAAVRAVQAGRSGGGGRVGPSLRGESASVRGAAARNRMEARETFRHRMFG